MKTPQVYQDHMEKEYRRGYVDGFLAALEAVEDGFDLSWLHRFHGQVLDEFWAVADFRRAILPPKPELWIEADDGKWLHFGPEMDEDK